eukprot:g4285.t1
MIACNAYPEFGGHRRTSHWSQLSASKRRREMLNLEQRLSFTFSVILLASALGPTLYLLHRIYKERQDLHILQLAMAWLLMADLAMMLNYIPHHMSSLIQDQMSDGLSCQISGYISLVCVVFSNLAATSVSLVTARSLNLQSSAFNLQFRKNYLKWTVAMWLPGVILASALSATGRIGNYRGLYCCMKNNGDPSLVWTGFLIFFICAATQCYQYYTSFDYVSKTMTATQEDNEVKCKSINGIRDHALRMSGLFYFAWQPMLIGGFITYGHGGVVTQQGPAFHVGWDVLIVLFVKVVPVLDCWVVFRSLVKAKSAQAAAMARQKAALHARRSCAALHARRPQDHQATNNEDCDWSSTVEDNHLQAEDLNIHWEVADEVERYIYLSKVESQTLQDARTSTRSPRRSPRLRVAVLPTLENGDSAPLMPVLSQSPGKTESSDTPATHEEKASAMPRHNDDSTDSEVSSNYLSQAAATTPELLSNSLSQAAATTPAATLAAATSKASQMGITQTWSPVTTPAAATRTTSQTDITQTWSPVTTPAAATRTTSQTDITQTWSPVTNPAAATRTTSQTDFPQTWSPVPTPAAATRTTSQTDFPQTWSPVQINSPTQSSERSMEEEDTPPQAVQESKHSHCEPMGNDSED